MFVSVGKAAQLLLYADIRCQSRAHESRAPTFSSFPNLQTSDTNEWKVNWFKVSRLCGAKWILCWEQTSQNPGELLVWQCLCFLYERSPQKEATMTRPLWPSAAQMHSKVRRFVWQDLKLFMWDFSSPNWAVYAAGEAELHQGLCVLWSACAWGHFFRAPRVCACVCARLTVEQHVYTTDRVNLHVLTKMKMRVCTPQTVLGPPCQTLQLCLSCWHLRDKHRRPLVLYDQPYSQLVRNGNLVGAPRCHVLATVCMWKMDLAPEKWSRGEP